MLTKYNFSFGSVYCIDNKPTKVYYEFLKYTATHPSLTEIDKIWFSDEFSEFLVPEKPIIIDEFVKREFPEYFL